jgi:cobaltochelatase CobT
LKENIDGEALVWAYERASERSEQIKHIIHLSDGAPVDDSTMANNSGDFLTSHLHHVLTALQNDENTKVHL